MSDLTVTPMPDTAFNRRMADGHRMRVGHTLDARSVSSDGVLWHTVRLCCGDALPSSVPTWSQYV